MAGYCPPSAAMEPLSGALRTSQGRKMSGLSREDREDFREDLFNALEANKDRTFAEEIRYDLLRRIRAGEFLRSHVAKHAGLTDHHLSMFLDGCDPRGATIDKIMRAMGVEVKIPPPEVKVLGGEASSRI